MESATRTLQAERRIIQCEAVKMEESRTQRLAILRDAVLRTAPQRLSCVSSGLPWPIVSEDGVEDGQKLSSDRDEGNHLWLARRHQAIEEGLQDWVVLLGDHRAHEEDGAHWSAPATDKAVAPPLAGLASEGGKARQSGDLFAAELPELGQLGDQCASDGRADARHRGEQVFLVAPGWRAPYRIIDVGVDVSQLLLQCLEEPIDAFLEARDRDTLLALAFGTDHLDDLPPPRNEVGQQSRRLVRERTRLGLGASAKCAMTAASIGSVFARWPIALAKERTWAGLTMTTGSSAEARAAAATVSKPPVASKATIRGEMALSRLISCSSPAALRSTTKNSPLGRTATSSRSFETSIPTMMFSMSTHPCLIGLRALRPRRLSGFNGIEDGVPC